MKNFTPYSSLNGQMKMEANSEIENHQSPKNQTINFILVYSKSIEAYPSKHLNKMILNLN